MIGKTVSHYRILQKVGQGGMGEVFLAQDTSLERKVAIKFLPQEMWGDPVARERFLREAKSAATLDHPNICVVHEASEIDGVPFIVMEYVEGESLKDRLARGPLPPGEAVQLAAETAEGLEEAHSRHVIHRDLKPANIMITRAGHAKVMDFGLAKRLLSAEQAATEKQTITELTEMGATIGTLAYMSPEQLQGQMVDHRTDIFSFGAVLYEMLVGVHPFRKEVGMATAAAILSKEPAPLDQYAHDIPGPLAKLVTEMLSKAPERRPQSMQAIRVRLKRILAEVHPQPYEAGVLNLKKLARDLRKPLIAVPAAVVLIALLFLSTWFFKHQARVRWAREEALPEIARMIGENDVWRNLIPAYRLAETAEAVIPHDPRLNELLSRCSLKVDIKTEPPGARIYMKEYAAPDSEWTYLGVSPIEKARLPIGIFRWKIEKGGYETVLAASSTWSGGDPNRNGILLPYDLVRTLDKNGTVPRGMVRVQGAKAEIGYVGDFYIDRYEVTNKEFKEFVDNGGYRKKEYWKQKFVKDGRELSWEEAGRTFVDQTNQPGPATWQAGDYPEGQGDYPVSGVSWYEAAAYAEYAGKSLPTGDHWAIARGEYTPWIMKPQLGGIAIYAPFSNFSSKGPVAVGSVPGIASYGAFDMAGNVREWCWNETPQGRLIRGGAWGDNPYMVEHLNQAPPMDRSGKTGFRCAFYPDPEKIPSSAYQLRQISEPIDFYRQTPVSDAIFRVYKDQFSYDNTDLKPRVESRQKSAGGWIREKVTFDAAYGGERVVIYLFLPEKASPPYQGVLYFPADPCFSQRSSEDIENYYEFSIFLSFIVKNGRAVLFPVCKGAFERGNDALTDIYFNRDTSRQFTQLFVEQIRDFRRSIDYLETRRDINAEKLAYYGMCSSGSLGAIIPAVEERLKANIIVAGGFWTRGRPEISLINFVTRVKTPTLMLNGKYDVIYPLMTSSKPMFDLLGTREKQQILYETDHIPPRNEFVKETLAWLDRYLGRVN